MTTSFDRAEALVRGLAPRGGTEWVPLREAAGRIAAETVHAPGPLPRAPRAAMDGYALRYEDIDDASWERQAFPVAFELLAGDPPLRPLPAMSCAAVATGAWLPDGASVVVPWEWTQREGGTIRLKHRPERGQNVMLPGEEVREGAPLVRAGERIHARHLAGLAAFGIRGLAVRRRLRVAIFQTGDELADVDESETAGPYRIVNSSAHALRAELAALGFDVRDFGRVPDRLAALHATIAKALDWNPDAVVTTGGVSVGSRDLVPAAWEELGARRHIWRVTMKPGKALYVASLDDVWIFGLSGNPPAALAAYYALVRPGLAALAGVRLDDKTSAVLANDCAKKADRTRLLWAVRTHRPGAYAHLEGAPVLESIIRADALLVLPPRKDPYRAGDVVEAVRLDAPVAGPSTEAAAAAAAPAFTHVPRN